VPAPTRRALRRWGAFAAALVCLVVGLAVPVMVGLELGMMALVLGLALATLPVPLYVTMLLWIDRFEAEPPELLGLSFFLGATASVFTAAVANTAIRGWAGDEPALEVWVIASGPVVEELSKGAVLIGLFLRRKDEFDGVLDGIVYAGMVGLGFAMAENIQYYGHAAFVGGIPAGTRIFVLRGLLAPFAHPLFTAATGVGLGLALSARRSGPKLALCVFGLLASIALHAIWNLSALYGGATLKATYVFVMVPVFALGLLLIALEIRREGRLVAEQMRQELRAGLLSPAEHERLASVPARLAARWQALRRDGFAAWRASGRPHQLAGELAMLRQRIAVGVIEADDATRARERTLVDSLLAALRTPNDR
jgi:RsiW-degrading membrane proteinase PrsW (M82 family)